MTRAVEVIENLEGLLDSLLGQLDLSRHSIILTSDHGNVEDLSTKRHTLNLVPTLLWGKGAADLAATIRDLSDIGPAILRNVGVVY
jgi:bisphosphoglycerate-independent phosphoglycerate mutase (AlkP superfamily)